MEKMGKIETKAHDKENSMVALTKAYITQNSKQKL